MHVFDPTCQTSLRAIVFEIRVDSDALAMNCHPDAPMILQLRACKFPVVAVAVALWLPSLSRSPPGPGETNCEG